MVVGMHEDLRAELLRREAVDQDAGGRLVAIDRDNTARMHGVIREHGWPGRSPMAGGGLRHHRQLPRPAGSSSQAT